VAPALDSIVEAVAGEVGYMTIQAKDAFGNNKLIGGDNFEAQFQACSGNRNPVTEPCPLSGVSYKGVVSDQNDGTYVVTYTIPIAGTYNVKISLGGFEVLYCTGASGALWNQREYDGKRVYTAPNFCKALPSSDLNVMHAELHASSTTAAEIGGATGLSTGVVGIENTFNIRARDKFDNLREGNSLPHFNGNGDGSEDYFIATLTHSNGYSVTTSSAVQTITIAPGASGYYRLSFAGATSVELATDIDADAMAAALMAAHGDGLHLVEVNKKVPMSTRLRFFLLFLSGLLPLYKRSMPVMA
jgi:hypothetical protein